MKKILGGLGFAITLLVSQNINAATTPNANYCNVPPYLTQNVKPNIHFIFDHSGSFGFYPYVLNNQASNKTVTYPSTTEFYGYFEKDKYYKYDASVSSGTWVVNSSCTGEDDKIGGKTAGQQCISGNLLNFVTTSRIDVIRKIMTGGRLLPGTTDVFQHEGENQFGGYAGGTLINPFGINSLNCKFHIDRTSAYNVDNDGTTPFTHDATLSIFNNIVMTLTTNGETMDVDANNGASPNRTAFHRDLNASPNNVPTRSFLEDGWAVGMTFTTAGFANTANNGKQCTINYVDADDIRCTGVIAGMVDETNRAGVDLIENVAIDSSNQCVLGTQTDAKIQVQGTAPGTSTGLIPSLYPGMADIEFSFYSGGNTTATPDVYKVAYDGGYKQSPTYRTVKSQALSNYLDALNYSRMWGGTPTGSAVIEAQKFFQQTALSTTDSSYPSSGTLAVAKANAASDPYYYLVDGSSLAVPCRKSFNILVSDGEWSGTDPDSYVLAMHTTDQRPHTGSSSVAGYDTNMIGNQLVTTYVVFAFTGGESDAGRNSMKAIAAYGGFNDKNLDNLPYDLPAVSADSKTITWPRPNCNPSGTWNSECSEWDKSPAPHTGVPYNFFEANDGDALEADFYKVVNDIFSQVSSGTAASILGNNDNNGATLLQALFYPDRTYDDGTKSDWSGEIQAFWYYIDPQLNGNNITIREDTLSPNQLILNQDRIAEFSFDGTATKVNLYSDTNGDGIKDNATIVSTVLPDDVKAIWRAGKTLWERAPSTRTIFTNDPTQATATKLAFTDTYKATLAPYLDAPNTSPYTVAANYINYIRGTDVGSSIRNRTVSIKDDADVLHTHVWKLGDVINSTPKMLSEVRLNNYNLSPPSGYGDSSYDRYIRSKDYNSRGVAFSGANDGMLHAFKLGTNFPGGTQGVVAEIKNSNGSAATELGKELWAFIPKNTLPYLQYLTDSNYRHVYYVDSTPLLVDVSINPTKYRVDSSTILTCDGTSAHPYSSCARATTLSSGNLSYDISNDPTVIGASTGTSWRTLLLGSTGLGGATSTSQAVTTNVSITINAGSKTFTRTSGSFLTDGWVVGKKFTTTRFANAGNNGTFTISTVTDSVITCSTATTLVNEGPITVDLMENVVKTPLGTALGYSSYFALDVTDPQVSDLTSPATYPKLLWEFSDQGLGFTTSTPAVVRIKDASDNGNPPRNGKWYAIIASGPTGPIDTYYNQNLQFSTQPLKIYVLDLLTGNVVWTFSSSATAGTNRQFILSNAFANSITSGTIDIDRKNKTAPGFYSDDAIYIGYTQMDTSTNKWTKGGVLRIMTNNNPDPSTWTIATVIDDIGPVTSAIKKLQNPTTHKLWLYFGTGRYFYKTKMIDDADSRQALYGIMDPCYTTSDTYTTSCSPLSGTSSLSNQDSRAATDTSALSSGSSGWYINLANTTGSYKAERVISDPIATSTGTVFFTTFYPSSDLCSYGGQSSVWAVKYDTGGVAPANLVGQMLIQLSTGAFKQINLATDFTASNGRQTVPFPGVSPRNEASITSNANHFPTKRILHIQER